MNIFAKTELRIPEIYKEVFQSFCKGKNYKYSPFPRAVDMWFLAICIAVRENIPPVKNFNGKTYKAMEGGVLVGDDDVWRSHAIILLAIAHTGTVKVIENPGEMIKIANEYFLAGIPRLKTILEDSSGNTVIDHLSGVLSEMMQK